MHYSFFLTTLLLVSACSVPDALVKPITSPLPSATTQSATAQTRSNVNINVSLASPSPSAQPSAQSPPEPTPLNPASPAPLPTATASPSPSASPRPSPTPFPTPTPVPTATPIIIVNSGSNSSAATPAPVTVSSVKAGPATPNSLLVGETHQLFAQVNFSNNTTSQAVLWSSSHPAIASVDANGKVTALKPGLVNIVAKASADANKLHGVALTITAPVINFTGKIIYEAGRDIYLLNGSNASPQRLTFDGATEYKDRARLSWRGDMIAWRTDHDNMIMIRSDGTGSPVFYDHDPSDLRPKPYFWFNDEIVFQDHSPTDAYNLFRMKLDGTVSYWTNSLGLIGEIAGITSTGWVVFEQAGVIRGSQYNQYVTVVTYATGANARIAMNPNPNLIVYSKGQDIWTVPMTGGAPQNLTQRDGFDEFPTISPDETQIAFVSDRDGSKDVFIMNADGSNVRNLTNTPNIDEVVPDWSN